MQRPADRSINKQIDNFTTPLIFEQHLFHKVAAKTKIDGGSQLTETQLSELDLVFVGREYVRGSVTSIPVTSTVFFNRANVDELYVH